LDAFASSAVQNRSNWREIREIGSAYPVLPLPAYQSTCPEKRTQNATGEGDLYPLLQRSFAFPPGRAIIGTKKDKLRVYSYDNI
jgi:hypothetical protein